MNTKHSWPPVPGDFEVNDPTHSVAICTLGKKLNVTGNYAIIGTCKTENIGIERVILNIISNSNIRFLILAGPEVPGHLTGRTIKSLFQNGVDIHTRKIIDAEGAIPYIENVTLEGIDRFRKQIELIEMINIQNPEEIARIACDAHKRNPGIFPDEAMWLDFRVATGESRRVSLSSDIILLPEYNLVYDHLSSQVSKPESYSYLSQHPSTVVVELRTSDTGTILVGKEV